MSKVNEDQTPQTPGRVPVPKIKKGVVVFLKEAFGEMKKVNWPTRQETNRLTSVVFAVCLMVVGFLLATGLVLEFAINPLMGKKG